MRSRFDEQLALLNKELISMGALCEEAIALASRALMEGNKQLAGRVAPLDAEIDQKERTIESMRTAGLVLSRSLILPFPVGKRSMLSLV